MMDLFKKVFGVIAIVAGGWLAIILWRIIVMGFFALIAQAIWGGISWTFGALAGFFISSTIENFADFKALSKKTKGPTKDTPTNKNRGNQ